VNAEIVDLLRSSGPTTSIRVAAKALGVGGTTAYDLARRGEFPAKVIKVGAQYRVVTRSLLDLLDLAAPAA
jgi:predicted DNA-binding transcriptional regulator AlpA